MQSSTGPCRINTFVARSPGSHSWQRLFNSPVSSVQAASYAGSRVAAGSDTIRVMPVAWGGTRKPDDDVMEPSFYYYFFNFFHSFSPSHFFGKINTRGRFGVCGLLLRATDNQPPAGACPALPGARGARVANYIPARITRVFMCVWVYYARVIRLYSDV